MLARLCLWHSCSKCLPPPQPLLGTFAGGWLCNGSRRQTPTDGASYAAAPQCEADRNSRRVLVSASGTRVKSACRCCHDDKAREVIGRWQRSHHQAPTDGASLRLLHGARRRQTQSACSSLPLALVWRSACHVTRWPGTSAGATKAAIKALTGGASVRLLHGGARRRRTFLRQVLASASGTRWKSALSARYCCHVVQARAGDWPSQ